MQKLIAPFDPWKSQSCACPKKYCLNVYTGCAHRCLYCYSSSYIPDFFGPRKKKDLLKRISKDIETLDRKIPISISNSTDPYQSLERTKKDTRKCLELLRDFKKLIVTKSPLVTRDIDLFSNTVVAITITTDDETLAKLIEPGAPAPQERLNALKILSDSGIQTIARIDPIIPHLNEDASNLIEKLKYMGVKHIVSSTYKSKKDSMERLTTAFREHSDKWHELYNKKGETISGARYLSKDTRLALISKIKEQVESEGMTFAACRENITLKPTSCLSCDGSNLLETSNIRLSS